MVDWRRFLGEKKRIRRGKKKKKKQHKTKPEIKQKNYSYGEAADSNANANSQASETKPRILLMGLRRLFLLSFTGNETRSIEKR